MEATVESPLTSGHGRARGPRVFVYCHDSVGIGHLRRSLNICERLSVQYPDACFLLATGTPYVQLFNRVPHLDCIKLPALAKTDNGVYRSKYLVLPADKLMHCRQGMLLQVAQDFEPDVVLVDKAPLGVCRELVPTLRWIRAHRPRTRVVFGMRDIEDDSATTIELWDRDGVPAVLEECFDEIWVYGLREVFDVAAEYRLSAPIREKLRFVGYIGHPPCDHPAPARTWPRRVLVTVGGGTDGERVLEAYLAHAGRRMAALGVCSTLVGGPDLPGTVAARLREESLRIPGVEWLDFETCMSCRYKRADLVVSMGGYNTMCELAVHRKPAIVVPRTQPRLEQAMRARLWSLCAPLRVVPQDELSAARLAEAVEMMAAERNQSWPEMDFSGLDRVAERFGALWSVEASHAPALCL